MGTLYLGETSTPNTPPASQDVVYSKTDHTLYWKDPNGVEHQIASGNQLGQCRLAKSSSNLVLSPFNGNSLYINGAFYSVPDAGVSLGIGAAAANTTYYIYAYMSSGTMTLEFSATAYAVQAGTGVYIKSGDATRTLVGMARANATPAWADSATQRFVRSWFNDPGIGGQNNFTLTRGTTSTTSVEINSEIRVEFLVWSGEAVTALVSGGGYKTDSSNSCATSVGFDGATGEAAVNDGQSTSATVKFPVQANVVKAGLSEGYHYATVVGWQVSANTGTCNWEGGGAGSVGSVALSIYAKR